MKKYYIFTFTNSWDIEHEVLTDETGHEIYSVRDIDDCPEDARISRDLLSCGEFIELASKLEFPNEIKYIKVPKDEEDLEYYIQAFFQKAEA